MLARSLTSRDAALPAESLKALDWLNFFLAALLMGFGPFVAVHLTENGWAPASIGAVLTISGLAGLTTQVPAGELIDMIAPKRALVGVAVTAAALALTIFGLRSDFPSVAGAAIIQGAAGSVFGPSIAAISLGLVGHDALAERLGRNQRFASIGGLSAAAILLGAAPLPMAAVYCARDDRADTRNCRSMVELYERGGVRFPKGRLQRPR